jgi:indolepyruvate ferredoxin oxidoreductase beta subunit
VNKVTSILIAGVGGQGILLASEILSDVALEAGLDVKKSEVHGMAQRGGSVVCNVRFGEKVYSPLIKKGEADVILSFEKLEALRWVEYAGENCAVYSNNQQIYPMSVTFGDNTYATDVEERVSKCVKEVIFFDALTEAVNLGSPRCVNVIMLGMLSTRLEFPKADWISVLEKRVKPGFLEMNKKAFERGVEIAGS